MSDSPLAYFQARYEGVDYRCAVERSLVGTTVRLYAEEPLDGFEFVDDTRYVKVIAASECEAVLYRHQVGLYRNLECVIVADEGSHLEIEYAAGDRPAALKAGFTQVERGVYRLRVEADLVRARRIANVMIRTPEDEPI